MPRYVSGVLYAPNSNGYEAARSLRARKFRYDKKRENILFPKVKRRARDIELLPHLLVARIKKIGYET